MILLDSFRVRASLVPKDIGHAHICIQFFLAGISDFLRHSARSKADIVFLVYFSVSSSTKTFTPSWVFCQLKLHRPQNGGQANATRGSSRWKKKKTRAPLAKSQHVADFTLANVWIENSMFGTYSYVDVCSRSFWLLLPFFGPDFRSGCYRGQKWMQTRKWKAIAAVVCRCKADHAHTHTHSHRLFRLFAMSVDLLNVHFRFGQMRCARLCRQF